MTTRGASWSPGRSARTSPASSAPRSPETTAGTCPGGSVARCQDRTAELTPGELPDRSVRASSWRSARSPPTCSARTSPSRSVTKSQRSSAGTSPSRSVARCQERAVSRSQDRSVRLLSPLTVDGGSRRASKVDKNVFHNMELSPASMDSNIISLFISVFILNKTFQLNPPSSSHFSLALGWVRSNIVAGGGQKLSVEITQPTQHRLEIMGIRLVIIYTHFESILKYLNLQRNT